MKILAEIVYFVFPLLFAGLIHHLIIIKYNLFSFLAIPIDRNIRYNNKPIFGKSKTWRGLLIVPIFSSIGCLIVSYLVTAPTTLNPLFTGLLIGFGYAVAELPNSFIKRQLSINSGEKENNRAYGVFLLVDQIDSVVGAIIILLVIYPASFILCLSILIIGGLLHFSIDSYLHKYGYKKLLNKQ
jgi:CDP-diacylglycerol--serine O-phosphatidyltransferase